MLIIGGLLAAIAAGLVVRGILNASHDDTVRAEEHVQAAGLEPAAEAPVVPPAEVTGWTPGAAAPQPPGGPPAWSSGSYAAAPVEPPSDPGTSMVGIAPAPETGVREAARNGHVFTNDDLVKTRAAEVPAAEPGGAPPSPVGDGGLPRGETVARADLSRAGAGTLTRVASDPESRVAEAQRRVLAIRDRARATGQDLDDEMEDAIDAVREAQKEAIRARRD
jgi:hypothetical protein